MFSLNETKVHYEKFEIINILPIRTDNPVPANLKGARAKAEHDRLDRLIKKHEAHMPNDEVLQKLLGVIYKEADLKSDQRVFTKVDFPEHIQFSIFKRDHIWKPLAEGKLLDADKFDEFKQKLEAWRATMKKENESAEIQQSAINDGNAIVAMFIKHSEFKNICCFEGCENNYGQFGNNPAPFRFPTDARCCDECNNLVICRRIFKNKKIKTPQGFARSLYISADAKADKIKDLEANNELHQQVVKKLNEQLKKTTAMLEKTGKYETEAEKYKRLYEKEQRENKKLLKKQNKMLEDAMRKERAENKTKICNMERKIIDLKRRVKKQR